MAWEIFLQDENGAAIATIDEFLNIDEKTNLSIFKLLRYLDPYGDAIYNRLQMGDLIEDLMLLKQMHDQAAIDEIIKLADECKNGIHKFLAFYGE